MKSLKVRQVIEIFVQEKVITPEVAELLLIENNCNESPLEQAEPTQLFKDLTELTGNKLHYINNKVTNENIYCLERIKDHPRKSLERTDKTVAQVTFSEKMTLDDLVLLLVSKEIISNRVAGCLKRQNWFDESPLEEDGATHLLRKLVELIGFKIIETRDFDSHENLYELVEKDSKESI